MEGRGTIDWTKQGSWIMEALPKTKEAVGADNYHGWEISLLPKERGENFYEITAQKREHQWMPGMMSVARQASLPKAGKPAEVANL